MALIHAEIVIKAKTIKSRGIHQGPWLICFEPTPTQQMADG
jgi:hypothetical protein